MSQKFWMSLDQVENPEEFSKTIPGEFTSTPVREGFEQEGVDRRNFMKLMGASALMASMAGCTRRPIQKIVPYVNNPEEIIPGQPNFYASADPLTGYGLIVKTREGRPIKVDGNADHPVNRGGLHARGQATVHDLYDPDRIRAPRLNGAEAKWEEFDAKAKEALAATKGSTWILTGTIMSPTIKAAIAANGYRHVMVDTLGMDDVLDGQAQSFGTRVFPRFRFDKADYVVSFDADFLDNWGSTVEYTRQYADKRRLSGTKISMSKHVAFEGAMRLTGQNADLRIPVHPNDLLLVALGLAHEVARNLGRSVDGLSSFSARDVAQRTGVKAETLEEVGKDLSRFKGRSLLVASGKGPQAIALQNVVNFINSMLENDGETIDGTLSPSNQFQGSFAEFGRLLAAIRSGSVKTLIIQGINPLYFFADTAGVKEALKSVPNVIYFGSYLDETATVSRFVAAESHAFEAWGDVSAQKDLYSIVQPTIRPLWQTRSLLECLVNWSSATGNAFAPSAYDAVVNTFKSLHSKYGVGKPFQDWWDDTLMSGVFDAVRGRDERSSPRAYRNEALNAAVSAAKGLAASNRNTDLTLVLTTSVGIGDGSQANNAILQELPDPVTKNTWGNYLAVAPATAKQLNWKEGDFVKIENAVGSVELSVTIQPGNHPNVASAHLGFGRKFNGRIGNGVGVSFANFTATSVSAEPLHMISGLRFTKTGSKETVPCTQGHHTLEGRDIVFDTSLEEYRKDPKSGIVRHFPDPPSIWSGHEYQGYKWGMSIDTNACTGCSACVIACSVENNVPAVGKDQVQKGREMQWIRIDRYYSEDPVNPETIFQPMLCQHCDNAPCETVCPVLATTHSSEGLNQMTYNRCVGTKYCSNNCPYKVRRFNWFNNNADMNAPLEHPVALMKNPEVTLRSRGVMEKCTFCVQRIEAGKSNAKAEGRRATDNDIRTACQDACPADAIVFGDLNNPESRVAKMRLHPRGYTSLEETNVRPAVTYLTKIRNRPGKKTAGHHGEEEGHNQGEHHS